MNHTNTEICKGCEKPFSRRSTLCISRCLQAYCQSCIRKLKQQPTEPQINDRNVEVKHSSQNIIPQQKKTPEAKPSRKEMCLLHNKEIDLVCIEDGVGICTNCALFGEHKNHNIKTVDSVIQECAIIAENTISVLSSIEQSESTASIKLLEAKIQQTFKDKKENLTKQIKGRFYKLVQIVRATEKTCLVELDSVIQQQKKIVKAMLQKQGEQQKKISWIKQAQKLISVVDTTRMDQITKYLKTSCFQSGLIKRGQMLLKQLNFFKNTVSEQLIKAVQHIQFQMDLSSFNKIINCCYSLSKLQKEKVVLKSERNQDELLLQQDQEQMFPITPSTIERQQILDSASSTFLDIPELPIEKMGINVNSFIEKSQRKEIDRSMIKQPLGVSNLENRRKKKIKIPEKYETMFQDLKNGRAQCADFTNAQLGDNTVVQLTQYIKNSNKLRTIKLIRNKLTDQCLIPLLQACLQSRVTSLNLGQNSFTDKALDILQRVDVKELKNITLSQNKLNLRNSKGKIAEFKRRGLTISI